MIGAGPVGLAAAAHLHERGLEPLVLERGAGRGKRRVMGACPPLHALALRHRSRGRTTARETSWQAPDPETYPTGAELVTRYLDPLAQHPRMQPGIRLGAEVVGITRTGLDKMSTHGREDAPFEITIRDAADEESTMPRRR